MLGPTLDTAIGIAFVFFLFSSLLTILMEIIAGGLKLRARALEDAIARLITNPDAPGDNGLVGKLVGGFGAATAAVNTVIPAAAQAETAAKAAMVNAEAGVQAAAVAAAATATAAVATAAQAVNVNPTMVNIYRAVSNHPLLRGAAGNDAPSYIPAVNFSAALIHALAPGGAANDVKQAVDNLPDGTSLKSTLQALIAQAQGDIDAFRTGVEAWFDAAMDRLSGDYKRFTQVITFVLGLALAVAINVDAIHVVQSLYGETAVRSAVATSATSAVNAGQQSAPSANCGSDAINALCGQVAQAQATEGQLWKVGPVGWTGPYKDWPALLFAICGWVLTAIAGLLGAPFWFDALSGLVNIRNAGPKPPSSTSSPAPSTVVQVTGPPAPGG